MATHQPAASKNIKIIVDDKHIELCLTVRGNPHKSEYLPATPGKPVPAKDELAKLLPATVKTWLNVWRAIQDDSWKLPDNAQSACESVGVVECEGDPYVTVWNKDWNGLSITVHSWDNGQVALDTVAQFQAGEDMLTQYAPKLGIEIAGQALPTVTPPSQPAKTTEPQTDKTIQFPQATGQFRPSRKLTDTLIQIETGKPDTPAWKDAIIATKRYDHTAVQYADKQLVAYELNDALAIETTQSGQVRVVVKTTNGIFSFWRNKRDSEEQTIDWQTLEKQLYSVGVKSELLVPGYKTWAHGYLIVKMAHGNGNEYANLYGFRALPDAIATAANQ